MADVRPEIRLAMCHDDLIAAATHLLSLKDGPRDARYEADKPYAWDNLRSAVEGCTAHPRWGHNAAKEVQPRQT